MSETVNILKGAKALVEKGWVQNAFAVTKEGFTVGPVDGNACKWCITGAIWAAMFDHNPGKDIKKVHYGTKRRYQIEGMIIDANDIDCTRQGRMRALLWWNDDRERTKEDVLKALDKTIEEVEKTDEHSGSTDRSQETD